MAHTAGTSSLSKAQTSKDPGFPIHQRITSCTYACLSVTSASRKQMRVSSRSTHSHPDRHFVAYHAKHTRMIIAPVPPHVPKLPLAVTPLFLLRSVTEQAAYQAHQAHLTNWLESCGGCCTARKLCSDLSHIPKPTSAKTITDRQSAFLPLRNIKQGHHKASSWSTSSN